jgi:glutaredoxin
VGVWLLAVWLGTGGAAGCRKERAGDGAAGRQKKLPAIRVSAKDNLLFIFKTDDGRFETVDGLEKVPAGVRGWVRVLDPSSGRSTGKWVYVADLCRPQEDGSYPYKVVSREKFEKSAARGCRGRGNAAGKRGAAGRVASRASAGDAGSDARVVVYITSTCPVCAQALSYLKSRSISFTAKDIGKDRQAALELARKAAQAGVQATGVPIFDVGGELIKGFDRRRLSRALRKLRRRGK